MMERLGSIALDVGLRIALAVLERPGMQDRLVELAAGELEKLILEATSGS